MKLIVFCALLSLAKALLPGLSSDPACVGVGTEMTAHTQKPEFAKNTCSEANKKIFASTVFCALCAALVTAIYVLAHSSYVPF